jgi:hypothetical protein
LLVVCLVARTIMHNIVNAVHSCHLSLPPN